jgi:hypothetical protein
MRIPSLISLVGFIMIIAGTYCPMLKAFGIVTKNVYGMNQPFGVVMLLVAVIGIVCVVFNQVKVARLAAWISLALVVLLYIAAFMKVHTSFSFIPFNSLAKFLTGKIKFIWGWYVLITGAVLALAVIFNRKPVNNINQNI